MKNTVMFNKVPAFYRIINQNPHQNPDLKGKIQLSVRVVKYRAQLQVSQGVSLSYQYFGAPSLD